MTPQDLGAARHPAWRPGQAELLARALAGTGRITVLDLPPGLGKSLLAICYAQSTAARWVYLTSTRGLQDQILRDFGSLVIDLRGMQNYRCAALPHGGTCDRGPCLDGMDCSYRWRGCDYYDALSTARKEPRLLSNYAMWTGQEDAVGERDLLVCDEAHDLPDVLCSRLRVELPLEGGFTNPQPAGFHTAEWAAWAKKEHRVVAAELRDVPAGTGEAFKLRKLASELQRLSEADDGWVLERTESRLLGEPVWPAKYVESSLFRGIPKILLASATLTAQSLRYLGVTAYHHVTAPSPWPPRRRPIYYLPTVSMRWGMSDYDAGLWVAQIDRIIEARRETKGIIHTVSYDRAKYLHHASRYRHLLILPTARGTREAVLRFKLAKPPAVLISPALSTGWDFPYDTARWQIIGKVPWPPVAASPLLQRRAAEDSSYSANCAAAALMQMAGRVVRAEDDMGETFIVDDTVLGLTHREKLLAPWWRQAFKTISAMPKAPA